MKRIFMSGLLAMTMLLPSMAQNCDLPVRISLDPTFTGVPESAQTFIENCFNRAITQNGVSTISPTTPFVVSLHADILTKDVVPGPPTQIVYNLGVTLYMVDLPNQKKISSSYLELKGVGINEVQAYKNAFRSFNSENAKLVTFIENGKRKVMDYYDTQYPNLIKEANRLGSIGEYQEALALLVSVPICSRGGNECAKAMVPLYIKVRDTYNLQLLNEAKALWAATQDVNSAKQIAALLTQIDPESSSYTPAMNLMKEIKDRVRADIDFEMRQKYNDQISLEKQRIECARAVGVAYGNGQKAQTTNLLWAR